MSRLHLNKLKLDFQKKLFIYDLDQAKLCKK